MLISYIYTRPPQGRRSARSKALARSGNRYSILMWLFQKLRILSISDLSSTGGAAIAGNRISDALRRNGAEVIQLSADGRNTKEQRGLFNGKKFSALQDLLSPLVSASKAKSLRDKNLNHQIRQFLQKERFDAINIHNLHSAGWPISLVSTALEFAPTVWTLHDCWSFLGSFYPTHCPASDRTHVLELNSFWRSIKCSPSRHSLIAATPSEWMDKQASSSHWNGFKVQTIQNPIPKSFFEPLDRESCKKTLGLSLETPIVLSIAGNLNEERKMSVLSRLTLKMPKNMVHKDSLMSHILPSPRYEAGDENKSMMERSVANVSG